MPQNVAANGPNGPVVLRGSSELALSETTDDAGSAVGCGWALGCAIHIKTSDINTADVSNEIDLVFQTTYDEGDSWVDVENLHLANSDDDGSLDKIVVIMGPMSSAVARAVTDGDLADNTKLDLPLGFQVRIKVKFENQNSNPSVTFTAQAKFF